MIIKLIKKTMLILIYFIYKYLSTTRERKKKNRLREQNKKITSPAKKYSSGKKRKKMLVKCYFCFRIAPTTLWERVTKKTEYEARVEVVYLVFESNDGTLKAYSCLGNEIWFPKRKAEMSEAFLGGHEWVLLSRHPLQIVKLQGMHEAILRERGDVLRGPGGQLEYAMHFMREEIAEVPAVRSLEELYLFAMGAYSIKETA